jgi:DNA-binding beta-propeller fold protein YncE
MNRANRDFETLKLETFETIFRGRRMQMKSRWVLAALAVASIAAWNGCAKANNPSQVTNSLMWIATAGDLMVRSYSINLTTGQVGQTGSAVATGVQPQAMALTPDSSALFIANSGDNTINGYSVNSNGTLKVQGSTHSVGQFPAAVAIDPSGKFLFAVDQQSGDVSSYKISSTSLTAVGATPTQSASSLSSNPSAIAVSPTGNFLYVANSATSTVLGFSYDSNGVLTPLPSANPNPCGPSAPGYCVQVGANPAGLAFSRCAGVASSTSTCATADGNNLFVSNAGSNNISIFTACIQASTTCSAPDGTLAALSSGGTVASCCGPATLMVDPAADFVYVLNRGAAQVGEFTYSPVTGTLTALSTTLASTGISPFSGGITANTSNTNWVYVSNTGASSISAFSVSAGRLTGLSSGPILVSGQPTAILVR